MAQVVGTGHLEAVLGAAGYALPDKCGIFAPDYVPGRDQGCLAGVGGGFADGKLHLLAPFVAAAAPALYPPGVIPSVQYQLRGN